MPTNAISLNIDPSNDTVLHAQTKQPMKIAQISSLSERVPPPGYGGIELVVSYLTDELVRRGHDVTLFASGDSQTLAKLEAVCPHALRVGLEVKEYAAYEMQEVNQVYQRAEEFDIIHSHVGTVALALASIAQTPTVHTLHLPFITSNRDVYTQHKQQAYVSISNAQRQINLNYVGTIYHGIDLEDYPFVAQHQEPPYLAFLGRLAPDKGPQHAIAIAKKAGWHLKMAGKIKAIDSEFYEQEVAPHIDGEQIQYLGEINHAEKVELLGNAAITLFPINWEEAFGILMIESMATGTPVIAMSLGSVPEVIAHGVSGFVCQSYDEMAAMIPAALELNRQTCREHVENKFNMSQMVDQYEAVYRKIIQRRT